MLRDVLTRAGRHSTCHRSALTRITDRGSYRSYATASALRSLPDVGAKVHGFTVHRSKEVPELNLRALQLFHDKTGAEYLHIARDDKNNVFSINFKTNTDNETGVPHILEHVTLCGSHKYPVRDPFFKMLPRSLSNFMNAFTAADYTSYPFATTNKQDFRNLTSVYLDATLSPLLKKSDFLQEGWRLGFEDPRAENGKDDVQLKGVVYNEMKGQMSDSSYLFYVRYRDAIYPSLHNSGGDPAKMTNLTYEELRDFHRRNYHPSNAKFFSYGDLDLPEQLKVVSPVLEQFDPLNVQQVERLPADLSDGPIQVSTTGPQDTMQSPDRQYKSSISWTACSSSDLLESFSLSLMTSLLMNGYGSPLYQGLIESGLGLNYSANAGFDASNRTGIITVGLDGMKEEDVCSFPETLKTILRTKAKDAFVSNKVDGLLHQLEIALKHKTSSFGIGTLEKTLPGWFNGVDPLDGLSWNAIINGFKEKYSQAGYLEELMEKYMLNDKYLQFTMVPSETHDAELQSSEAQRLNAAFAHTVRNNQDNTDMAVDQIKKQELNLLEEQEDVVNSNVDCLPTLRVQDISRTKEPKSTRKDEISNVKCLWRETATNGVTYLTFKHKLGALSPEIRMLLPLFAECLMRLGTRNKTVGDLEEEILLKTGGISVSPYQSPDWTSLDGHEEGLMISGYALEQNVPALLELMRTLTVDIDFTSTHAVSAVRELLESKVSGALDSVAESGNSFALTNASAALAARGLAQEQLSGLTQINATSELLSKARNDGQSLAELVDRLAGIQKIAISSSSSLEAKIVCEPAASRSTEQELSRFFKNLPNELPVAKDAYDLKDFVRGPQKAVIKLPFQVSYTASCIQTVPYTSPEKAPLMLLGQLLTHNYLHPEIREKGGAYGASASASPIGSLFSMSSYRDPNPKNSLHTFEKAGKYASEKDWSARELEEAKLSIFQRVDAPVDVNAEGSKEFMFGITDEMEQHNRERLLDVTKEDVQSAADKFLVQAPAEQRASVVLGEQQPWMSDFQAQEMKISA